MEITRIMENKFLCTEAGMLACYKNYSNFFFFFFLQIFKNQKSDRQERNVWDNSNVWNKL